MRRSPAFLLLGFALLLALVARAAEVLPPKPRDHFNDYAGLVSGRLASELDAQLTQYERETSNQILVAIYPRMTSDSSVQDFSVRLADAWRVGRAGRDNGAVLFIFRDDRQMFIQVGYGLEGALPDALCKRIIADEITPRFRAGDFSGGVEAGVTALLAAARGEYRGTGRTMADRAPDSGSGGKIAPWAGLAVLIVILGLRASRRGGGTIYGGAGRVISYGLWSALNRSSGGRSGGSGSGGSFSSGGGRFGGGGAGGSW